MTKKDFVAIAAIIRRTRNSASAKDTPDMRAGDGIATWLLAVRVAAYCAKDNDHFDRGRFLTACGVG